MFAIVIKREEKIAIMGVDVLVTSTCSKKSKLYLVGLRGSVHKKKCGWLNNPHLLWDESKCMHLMLGGINSC
jgi:hypothetical protein